MKVHTATFLASSISGLSLIACLIFIANIYNEVSECWRELDQEIGVFRQDTDSLWSDIIQLGQTKGRARRQAEYEGKPIGGGGPGGGGGPAGPGAGVSGGPSRPAGVGAAPGVPTGAAPPSVPPSITSHAGGGPGCSKC